MGHENAEKESERGNSIDLIYEDDTVVVINKPAGIMVHADGRGEATTVVDWFLSHVPLARGVGEPQTGQHKEPLERSGVVHRLDRETSGVMLLAKTQEAYTHLKTEFHERRTKKEYRAFVYGTMREQWGTVDRPIGRSARDFRLRSAQRGAKGKLRDAVTDWERIGQNDRYAYLRVMPKTGRTHQIRVHLKAIGRPVIGDMLYAPQEQLKERALGFERMALHAHILTVQLPCGETKRFIAPLPRSFDDAEVALATSG